jgi:hypothetical protein
LFLGSDPGFNSHLNVSHAYNRRPMSQTLISYGVMVGAVSSKRMFYLEAKEVAIDKEKYIIVSLLMTLDEQESI